MARTNAPVNIPNPFVTNPAQALAQGRFAPVRPTEEYSGVGVSISKFTDNFTSLTNWGLTAGVTLSGNTCMINPGGKIQYNASTRWSMVNSGVSLCINQLPDNAHYMGLFLGSQSSASSMQFALEIGVNLGLKCQLNNDAGATVFTNTTPYLPGRMNWVRMRESDGTVFWDYSADGIAWVTAYTYNHVGCAGMSYVAPVINPQSGATGPLIISQFNLPAPAPAPPGQLGPYTPTRTPVIPGLSIAATKLFGPRGLPVIAQTPHAPYGTTSGSFSWASAAAGQRAPTSTAGGTYGWASAATGSATRSGTATSSFGWTSHATGSRSEVGNASGSFAWSSTATGYRTPKATGTGGYWWSSSAHGTAPIITKQGAGTGAYQWAATAAGLRHPAGGTAPSYQWAATAAGARPAIGTAAAHYQWVTTATGQRIPVATSSGLYAWASHSIGYQGLAIAVADSAHTLTVAPRGFTITVTPGVRSITVAPASRTLTVAPGSRTLTVAPGSRTVIV